MARRRKGARVLGPYRFVKRGLERWRVVTVDEEGRATPDYFASKKEADGYAQILRVKLPGGGGTLKTALDEYELYQRETKGNKSRSVETTRGRLEQFFGDENQVLYALTVSKLAAMYERRRAAGKAVDTHRGELSEAKTFIRWCGKKGFVLRSLVNRLGEARRRQLESSGGASASVSI